MIQVAGIYLVAALQSASPTPSGTPEEARELFVRIEEKYVALPTFKGSCTIKGQAKGDAETTFTGTGFFSWTLSLAPDLAKLEMEGTLNKTRYEYGFEDTDGSSKQTIVVPTLFPTSTTSSMAGEEKQGRFKASVVRMGFMPAFIKFPERNLNPVDAAPEIEELSFASEKGAKADVKVLTYKVADSGEGGGKRAGATHKLWINAKTLVIQKREIVFGGKLTVTETWDVVKPKAGK